MVENFFSNPRDDIELTMRLSRRDVYPRLHIEFAPIYKHHLRSEADRLQQTVINPYVRNKLWRFDDLLHV